MTDEKGKKKSQKAWKSTKDDTFEEDQTTRRGVLPDRDLKKNLGCG
jgi:hypothetical protein